MPACGLAPVRPELGFTPAPLAPSGRPPVLVRHIDRVVVTCRFRDRQAKKEDSKESSGGPPCGFHEIPCDPCELSPGRTASFSWSAAVMLSSSDLVGKTALADRGGGGGRAMLTVEIATRVSSLPVCDSSLAGSPDFISKSGAGGGCWTTRGRFACCGGGCLNSGTAATAAYGIIDDAVMRPPSRISENSNTPRSARKG